MSSCLRAVIGALGRVAGLGLVLRFSIAGLRVRVSAGVRASSRGSGKRKADFWFLNLHGNVFVRAFVLLLAGSKEMNNVPEYETRLPERK